MDILNRENTLSNKQIQSIINLLGSKFAPRKIIVYERLREDLKGIDDNLIPTIGGYISKESLSQTGDGKYDRLSDTVYLCTYNQGLVKHSKQLYSIHGLISLLYLGKQFREYEIVNCEDESTNFATEFVNDHSEEISEIMSWKDGWEIEVED